MPELPEVETICRMLSESIVGQTIVAVNVIRSDLRWPIQSDFAAKCQHAKVIKVFRRAKYIIIQLDYGYIVWHLGMSGTIKLTDKVILKKHDHVQLDLSTGNSLVYNDPRRFGSVSWSLVIDSHPRLKHLGQEPFVITAEELYSLTCKRKKNIKDTIMDASIIVGVGNIYANEALFLAGIRPDTPAKNLNKKLIEVLLSKITEVLAKAISAGGTTLNDYVNLSGKPGYFQQELYVYGRSGQPCRVCGVTLFLQGHQRQTVYCQNCQQV